VGSGVGTVEAEEELGHGVDHRGGLGVTGLGIDVAADRQPGDDLIEVTKLGLDAGEDGDDGKSGGVLGSFKAHFARDFAKGRGGRPVGVESTMAGDEGSIASDANPGERDLHARGEARRRRHDEPEFLKSKLDLHTL
jgi:hypothetical protein